MYSIKPIKKEITLPQLKFVEHPILPRFYTYCAIKFANGEGVSICKQKKEKHTGAYQEYNTILHDKYINYEIMRFNKRNERFDNELITNSSILIKKLKVIQNLKKRKHLGK